MLSLNRALVYALITTTLAGPALATSVPLPEPRDIYGITDALHRHARALLAASPICVTRASPRERSICFKASVTDAPVDHDPVAVSLLVALDQVIAATESLQQGTPIPPYLRIKARQRVTQGFAQLTASLTDLMQLPSATDPASLTTSNTRLAAVSDLTLTLNRVLLTSLPEILTTLIDVHCETRDEAAGTRTVCTGEGA